MGPSTSSTSTTLSSDESFVAVVAVVVLLVPELVVGDTFAVLSTLFEKKAVPDWNSSAVTKRGKLITDEK